MMPYKIHTRPTILWADQFATILKASKLQQLTRQPILSKKKDWKNFSMKKSNKKTKSSSMTPLLSTLTNS